MNEGKALERLSPLVTSKAEVIKCNPVDIETFAIRSVYRNNVRCEVQYLPELNFLLSNLFVAGPALGHVGDRSDKLDLAGRIVKNMGSYVEVSQLSFERFNYSMTLPELSNNPPLSRSCQNGIHEVS